MPGVSTLRMPGHGPDFKVKDFFNTLSISNKNLLIKFNLYIYAIYSTL